VSLAKWAGVLCCVGAVAAQDLRDPTVPPLSAGLTPPSAATDPGAADISTVSVVIRDGVPRMVVGTRLYAQGQKFGNTQIERITESEVWLLENGSVRKVPIFSGVERRATVAATASSTPSTAPLPAVVKP